MEQDCAAALLHPPPASLSSGPLAPTAEPMQIDSFHLSHSDRQWRIINHLCLYCGGEGHLLPVHPPHPVVSTIPIPPVITNLKHTFVCFNSDVLHMSICFNSDYYTSLRYHPGPH